MFQMGDDRQKHQRASFRIARETGVVKKKKKRFENLFIYSVLSKHAKRQGCLLACRVKILEESAISNSNMKTPNTSKCSGRVHND